MKLIALTKGYSAMVDDADFEWLNQWKWYAYVGKYTVYAVRNTRSDDGKTRVTQKMHRLIMGVNDPKIEIDHKFHNGLDNQRANLRISTKSQNQRNRRLATNNASGYKGVSWHKGIGKFVANYKPEGQQIYMGAFDCPVEAARHYNKAAKDHGEGFEHLNQVDPMFPTMEYINEKTKKSTETKGRTEEYLLSVENGTARIKHPGIKFDNKRGKWRTWLKSNYIGMFFTQDEAIEAQNKAKALIQ